MLNEIKAKGISLEEEIKNINKFTDDFYKQPNQRDYEIKIAKNQERTDNKIMEDVLEFYFQISETMKKNNSVDIVLAKVTLLNSFYRTMLKNIDLVAVARHIVALGFDERIQSKTPNVPLVHAIAGYCEQTGFITDEMKHMYSFATKYCAWHQPDIYPIADSYTKGMLYYINKDTNFYGRHFTHKDLNLYDKYIDIYSKFRKYLKEKYGVTNKLKEIDIFLWSFGKNNNIKSDESSYQ